RQRKSVVPAGRHGDGLIEMEIGVFDTHGKISAPGLGGAAMGKTGTGMHQIGLRRQVFGTRHLAIARRDARPALGLGRVPGLRVADRRRGRIKNIAGAVAKLQCRLSGRPGAEQRQGGTQDQGTFVLRQSTKMPLFFLWSRFRTELVATACQRFTLFLEPLQTHHSAVMRVPAPCSVKSSSSSTWGMRPSRITAAVTPASTASTAVWILGIMPPEMVPSAINSRASRTVSRGTSFLSLSSTPSTSVSSTRRSALTAPATAPATVSALMLKVSPRAPMPIGAITGMISDFIIV